MRKPTDKFIKQTFALKRLETNFFDCLKKTSRPEESEIEIHGKVERRAFNSSNGYLECFLEIPQSMRGWLTDVLSDRDVHWSPTDKPSQFRSGFPSKVNKQFCICFVQWITAVLFCTMLRTIFAEQKCFCLLIIGRFNYRFKLTRASELEIFFN